MNGATDRVIEFHGPVVEAMSMESRMTLCNMAIEAGGTSGICMPDAVTVDYLWPFIEAEYADKAAALAEFQRWHSDADAAYEKVLAFDVSALEPQVTYGYKPDCVKPVGEMAGTAVDQVYIGTCTNGRLEDLDLDREQRRAHDPPHHLFHAGGRQQIASPNSCPVTLGKKRREERQADDVIIMRGAEQNVGFEWHFSGQLQTRKASSVAQYADYVHSVDRIRLVSHLGAAARAAAGPAQTHQGRPPVTTVRAESAGTSTPGPASATR